MEITQQLDTATVDPTTVMFKDVRFGDTVRQLPFAEHQLDETIDLRPARDLLVHATAEVSGTGKITWVLQAIDPETLAPPDDPLAGFLPPNNATRKTSWSPTASAPGSCRQQRSSPRLRSDSTATP